MSSVIKFLLDSTMVLGMLVGCPLSGNPHSCEPCALPSSWPGLCWLPSSTFPCHPSWTCGGERSPVCCSVVKSERLKGRLNPGSWWWLPCHPSWGWLWKKPHGHCGHLHSWICQKEPLWPFWRETPCTPFCGCAAPKKRRMPVSGITHICSSHCSV